MNDQEKLERLYRATKDRAPDFWTVKQFVDFRIKEFGLDADVLLPDGTNAPDEMTLGELRGLYEKR